MTDVWINGFRMSYEKWGRAPVHLVLIHGNLASKRWWNQVKIPLSKQYSVYSLDLRGCGESEQPLEGYSVPQYGEDVLAFMNHMGMEKASLIGHSLGGAVAMDVASKEPNRIEKLVLLNSAPVFGFFTSPEKYSIIEYYATQRDLLKLSLSAIAPAVAGEPFFEELVDDAYRAAFTAVANAKSLSAIDYTDWARSYTHPVLILYGEKDTLIPHKDTERMKAIFPNAQLSVHPHVGHSPQLEDPEWFLKEVATFLSL